MEKNIKRSSYLLSQIRIIGKSEITTRELLTGYCNNSITLESLDKVVKSFQAEVVAMKLWPLTSKGSTLGLNKFLLESRENHKAEPNNSKLADLFYTAVTANRLSVMVVAEKQAINKIAAGKTEDKAAEKEPAKKSFAEVAVPIIDQVKLLLTDLSNGKERISKDDIVKGIDFAINLLNSLTAKKDVNEKPAGKKPAGKKPTGKKPAGKKPAVPAVPAVN